MWAETCSIIGSSELGSENYGRQTGRTGKCMEVNKRNFIYTVITVFWSQISFQIVSHGCYPSGLPSCLVVCSSYPNCPYKTHLCKEDPYSNNCGESAVCCCYHWPC